MIANPVPPVLDMAVYTTKRGKKVQSRPLNPQN